jgi:decaprenylphospho-beta-D-ribofuranose 2-oxidase
VALANEVWYHKAPRRREGQDSRVSPETFAAMYPRLADFRAVRAHVDPDGVLTSDLARRLAL